MPQSNRAKLALFVILTLFLVASQITTGVMELLQVKDLVDLAARLGYPLYILKILGPLKITGAIVIALPGLLRLKEWAYAGFFFDFAGAAASHFFYGDGLELALPPIGALAVLLGSYALRPAPRRL